MIINQAINQIVNQIRSDQATWVHKKPTFFNNSDNIVIPTVCSNKALICNSSLHIKATCSLLYDQSETSVNIARVAYRSSKFRQLTA